MPELEYVGQYLPMPEPDYKSATVKKFENGYEIDCVLSRQVRDENQIIDPEAIGGMMDGIISIFKQIEGDEFEKLKEKLNDTDSMKNILKEHIVEKKKTVHYQHKFVFATLDEVQKFLSDYFIHGDIEALYMMDKLLEK